MLSIHDTYVIYDKPVPSLRFNIALLVKGNYGKVEKKLISKIELRKKCVCLPERRGLAIFPILHEAETEKFVYNE